MDTWSLRSGRDTVEVSQLKSAEQLSVENAEAKQGVRFKERHQKAQCRNL